MYFYSPVDAIFRNQQQELWQLTMLVAPNVNAALVLP